MDYAQFKKRIIEYAKSIGIPKVGFTDARPLAEYLEFLIARQNAGYKYAINEGDPYIRIDPSKHLPGAESVISIAIPYPPEVYVETTAVPPEQSPRGHISLISRGKDYHELVMDKLRHLQDFIQEKLPGARIIPMVDKEQILEKALAAKAGLGWIGKNTLLVTPEFGSLICLGELVTNIPFPADKPSASLCSNCNRCLEACPTEALISDHYLNPDLCLAGVSQFKGNINHELREAMGVSIYGCDICQLACPYNRKALEDNFKSKMGKSEESSSLDSAYPLLADLLEITNKSFKEKFGHSSGAWRGRTVFQRNAIFAAGNLKSRSFVPVLTKILQQDSRPVIKSAAAWALGRIGDEDGLQSLQRALESETHPEVISEIKQALRQK